MKFKDWFSIKGIRSEIKRITWLSKEQLIKDSGIVIAFCLVFGLFFYLSDGIIAIIFKMLRIG
ncbi:MAG: preprotein translocase subunit SecE [Enterococcus sp.]|nr:preprotein translocase subunit SecE [Enterococcus sp.]